MKGKDEPKSKNITAQVSLVKEEDRSHLLGHKGVVLWFTGLSGAGKSTLAYSVENALHEMGCLSYVLDGDNIRHGLNKDLGFSPEDRAENIRRIGEVAALFAGAGMIVSAAFISPYKADRDAARSTAREGRFFEVYLSCSLKVCEERDVRGLYRKAREGLIKDFTGVSAPYEAPVKPELVLDTAALDVSSCVDAILAFLRERGILEPHGDRPERAGKATLQTA